jgi:AraC family transcriptional regulator, regulatory protein of adaptative response / DNA-3-methyladenine glycosylase II
VVKIGTCPGIRHPDTSLKVKSETGETAGVAGAILGLVVDDFDACWQAIESRDSRFDGRLFVGIVTTGVYCRPICPAPMPKRENVRFHASAAACEAAGFRPCRRCRPETAPGSPEWLGGSATVARALRLISEGFLDANPVGELARRLCVGERQLRRLFAAHLGAAPLAVARTRRVQLARMLIDQTELSMADVAMTSGFGSIRRFNETIRSAFGRSPTELRGSAPPVEGLVLRLPFRPPLAWEPIVRFLAARAIPGVEEVRDSTYRRTVRSDAEPGIVELERVPGQAHLRLRLRLAGIGALAAAVEQARRVFDLGADPLQIEATLRADGRLAPLLKRHPGLRVPGAWDPFELAVRAVLGQQVSVQAATTLAGRLVRAYGEQLPQRDGALTHVSRADGPRGHARRDDRAAAGARRDDPAPRHGGRGRLPRPRRDGRPGSGLEPVARASRHRALDGGVRRHAGSAGSRRVPRRRSRASACAGVERSAGDRRGGGGDRGGVEAVAGLRRVASVVGVTVSYATVESPIGPLLVAASPSGIVRIGLPSETPGQVLASVGPEPVRSSKDLASVRRQLDEYFAGTRREFTLPLDLSPASGFRRAVLDAMSRLPYGETVTYTELAARAGNPRAARAAGHACATNPIPIIVPCHRVIGSDGSLRGYTGGLHHKEFLLRLEGALLA